MRSRSTRVRLLHDSADEARLHLPAIVGEVREPGEHDHPVPCKLAGVVNQDAASFGKDLPQELIACRVHDDGVNIFPEYSSQFHYGAADHSVQYVLVHLIDDYADVDVARGSYLASSHRTEQVDRDDTLSVFECWMVSRVYPIHSNCVG